MLHWNTKILKTASLGLALTVLLTIALPIQEVWASANNTTSCQIIKGQTTCHHKSHLRQAQEQILVFHVAYEMPHLPVFEFSSIAFDTKKCFVNSQSINIQCAAFHNEMRRGPPQAF